MNDTQSPTRVDALVVGAGFGGLYMLHKLREMGLDALALEAGGGVGGTWYWNRYPGARCDIESIEYSYSFSPELEREWDWTERYAAQPEILRYANHVADRFDLRPHIRFHTRAVAARYDEADALWTVRTEDGSVLVSRFLIMAVGCLSSTKLPEIDGIDSFVGPKYHTGRWPHEGVDFTGKRVGIIGTGSSGIQTMTEVAKQAKRLVVFQRTAHYSLPAHNRPFAPGELDEFKAKYPQIRDAARNSVSGIARNPVPVKSALEADEEERKRTYDGHWDAGRNSIVRAYNDLLLSEEANATVTRYAQERVRGLVKSPRTAEALVPRHFLGTKRICLDSGYYDIYNQDNVELVNLQETPIERVTPTGIRTSAGDIALDALIFATGYDAVTGALLAIDVTTSSGRSLRAKWSAGPRCYLGLMTAGFPNLFIITGPQSPSILSNVILSIEHHVELVAQCLQHMRARGLREIDADPRFEDEWVAHVNEVASVTLYPRVASWYMGANVPGKPRVFLPYIGGVGRYQQHCRDVVADDWRGFRMRAGQDGLEVADADATAA